MTTSDMATTQALAELLSNASQARAAAEHAERWARQALHQHIAKTRACHLCEGSGSIPHDRLIACCDGHLCGCAGLPVWEQTEEPCPYGCDPAPPADCNPDDFCF